MPHDDVKTSTTRDGFVSNNTNDNHNDRVIYSGDGYRGYDSNVSSSRHVNRGKISLLSNYRMSLLGSNLVQKYLETGYIPEDLLD